MSATNKSLYVVTMDLGEGETELIGHYETLRSARAIKAQLEAQGERVWITRRPYWWIG